MLSALRPSPRRVKPRTTSAQGSQFCSDWWQNGAPEAQKESSARRNQTDPPPNLEPVACWRIPLVALASAHHESRTLDSLGSFAGDALGHHLDWLRYLGDDHRRSNFGERLHRDGRWCGAVPISWLRADGAAVLPQPSRVR